MRLKANIGVADILGHIFLWILIVVITLGIGIFFYPYAMAKFILNRSSIIDDNGKERNLKCNISVGDQIGHIILWIIITICTLGFGYFFYLHKVWNHVINKTKTED